MKLTEEELEFIRKYRQLDERGKRVVNNLLDCNYEFTVAGRMEKMRTGDGRVQIQQ